MYFSIDRIDLGAPREIDSEHWATGKSITRTRPINQKSSFFPPLETPKIWAPQRKSQEQKYSLWQPNGQNPSQNPYFRIYIVGVYKDTSDSITPKMNQIYRNYSSRKLIANIVFVVLEHKWWSLYGSFKDAANLWDYLSTFSGQRCFYGINRSFELTNETLHAT